METINSLANLLETFKADFSAAYKNLSSRNRARLLTYISCFYRRWFYSALVEDTIMTPANIMPILAPVGKAGVIAASAPRLSKKSDVRSISFVSCEYSLGEHPVVNDLEHLVNFCTPDAEFDDDDYLTGDAAEQLRSAFFINDPYYVEYLSLLAFKLGLLKRITSIHSNKAQPSERAAAFFAAPSREIFDKVFGASVSLSAEFIIDAIPNGPTLSGSDFIMSLLKRPRPTDEIFDEIYKSMGVSLNEFLDFDKDENGLDDIYNAMMSGTFYLGVILDKYFFTVFGYYLRLINPGYILPSDFNNELDYAADTIQYSEDISVGMFAPCSHYNLTVLGEEFFGIKDFLELDKRLAGIPVSALNEMITGGAKARTPERISEYLMAGASDDPENRVYELKIKSRPSKAYWKYIEFPHSMNLHDIYLFIAYEFGCDANMNYSFFPDTTANPFTAYTSPAHKRRAKKADKTALSDFTAEERSKFLMMMYDTVNPFADGAIPVKELPFEIEVLKIKPSDPRKHYPYVTRISQAFREFEFDDEWF